MHKKMTITLDEAVYEGLYRIVGRRKMSQFIEDLVRPHVVDAVLDAEYQEMAKDAARQEEMKLWDAAEDADFNDSAW